MDNDRFCVSTSITQAVQEMAHVARLLGRTTAVRDAAGIGKSTAAQYLASSDDRIVYGDARTFAAEKYFLRFITSALGMPVWNERSNLTFAKSFTRTFLDVSSEGRSSSLMRCKSCSSALYAPWSAWARNIGCPSFSSGTSERWSHDRGWIGRPMTRSSPGSRCNAP